MKKLAKLFIALRVVWWVSLRKKMKTKNMKKKSLRIVWPDLF
jgi:hypothetical protein